MTEEQKKWDAWYFQRKALFAELFDSPQDVFDYMWYKIAKRLNRILTGRNKSAICHDVLGDMMLRFEGNNWEYHRIMQDVLDDNPAFWSMESKHDLSWRGNKLSDNWLERLQDLDNETVSELAKRATLWLSWHEPYTLQYASAKLILHEIDEKSSAGITGSLRSAFYFVSVKRQMLFSAVSSSSVSSAI